MDIYANKENVPYINANERFYIPKKSMETKVDELASKVAGFKVFASDPRLLKLVVKWKKGKPQDSMMPDNFLNDPQKVQELKEALSGNL